jgi:hypothetical protein
MFSRQCGGWQCPLGRDQACDTLQEAIPSGARTPRLPALDDAAILAQLGAWALEALQQRLHKAEAAGCNAERLFADAVAQRSRAMHRF